MGSVGERARPPVWAISGALVCQLLAFVLAALLWGRWQAKMAKDPLGSQRPYLGMILRTPGSERCSSMPMQASYCSQPLRRRAADSRALAADEDRYALFDERLRRLPVVLGAAGLGLVRGFLVRVLGQTGCPPGG